MEEFKEQFETIDGIFERSWAGRMQRGTGPLPGVSSRGEGRHVTTSLWCRHNVSCAAGGAAKGTRNTFQLICEEAAEEDTSKHKREIPGL